MASKKKNKNAPAQKAPMGNKPTQNKPSQHKPAQNKPAQNKPAEKKAVEKKPVEKMAVEEKVIEKEVTKKEDTKKEVDDKPDTRATITERDSAGRIQRVWRHDTLNPGSAITAVCNPRKCHKCELNSNHRRLPFLLSPPPESSTSPNFARFSLMPSYPLATRTL